MTIPIEKIRPYGDRILIRRDDFDAVTPGGIIVPDVAKTAAEGSRQMIKRGRGVVLAVGPGKLEERPRKQGEPAVYTGRRVPPDVQPGDRVMFNILADLGDLDAYGHPDLTLIEEADIGCIVEDEP